MRQQGKHLLGQVDWGEVCATKERLFIFFNYLFSYKKFIFLSVALIKKFFFIQVWLIYNVYQSLL